MCKCVEVNTWNIIKFSSQSNWVPTSNKIILLEFETAFISPHFKGRSREPPYTLLHELNREDSEGLWPSDSIVFRDCRGWALVKHKPIRSQRLIRQRLIREIKPLVFRTDGQANENCFYQTFESNFSNKISQSVEVTSLYYFIEMWWFYFIILIFNVITIHWFKKKK